MIKHRAEKRSWSLQRAPYEYSGTMIGNSLATCGAIRSNVSLSLNASLTNPNYDLMG